MLMMIITLLLAALVFILQHLSFGLFVTKRLNIDLNVLEKTLLSIFLSFSLTAAAFFLLGQLIGPIIYYFSIITLLIGIYNIPELLVLLRDGWKELKNQKMLSGMTAFAVLSLYGTIAFSWIHSGGDLLLQAGQLHDSVWHLALINKLMSSIPPEHPSDYTLIVTNYHYFYDLIIAGMSKLFKFSPSILYFQLFPLILSFLLAGGAVALCKRLYNSLAAGYLVFLTFFAGSFAYLIPVFLPYNTWQESSFWVSQTFTMMINPQIILTLGLTFIVLLIMHIDLTNNKNIHFSVQAVLMLLISTSVGFKSYSFVILSVVYGAYLFIRLVKSTDKKYLIAGAIFLLISLPFLLLVTGLNSSSFIYKPLWFLDSMVESHDRLNLIEWKLLEDHYRMKGNWLRVVEIKGKELLIFFVGNLGIRFLAVVTIPLIILNKIKQKPIYTLIAFGFLFSSVFPLFFIQRGIVWNSIQFWYYALIFANIFAALVLAWIHRRIAGRDVWSKAWLVIFLVAIGVISLPTTIKTAQLKYSNFERISAEERLLLGNLSMEDTVVIAPNTGNRYFDTSLVSAVTNAKVVFANPVQLELIGIDIKDRENELTNLIDNDPENLLDKYPNGKLLTSKKLNLKANYITLKNYDLYLYDLGSINL